MGRFAGSGSTHRGAPHFVRTSDHVPTTGRLDTFPAMDPRPPTSGVSFARVNKTHADGTVAVRQLDLDCPAGAITVLVGPSGCGKTTVLRMVNRMVDPTAGTVSVDGRDVAGTDPVQLRRRIGYAMQNSGLLPHRTVVENVGTVLRLRGSSRAAARARSLELLDLVGLPRTTADRYPGQLSGGQQQRVGVARALSTDPDILLMDEPFGAIDPLVRADLQQELLRLQGDLAKTILFVTHDINEAFLLGDQVVVLRDGADIAQLGAPAQILDHPADAFVERFVHIATAATSRGSAAR
ncbi:MAG: transporter ATP-binding protein [Thermoleophilia bacterium]|nr:transporter ATP-binding protein [Thermoleophilia bacterium]